MGSLMETMIVQASSYANDIDSLIVLVAILGGFWFFLAEGVLFYFIFRFSRKRNPKAQYITGEKHSEMRWIHWPHHLVLICDIVIIVVAISVWHEIKQTLPPADRAIRIIGQQWAWTFVHPGKDAELDTDDDVTLVDALHVEINKVYHFKLEAKDVLHSFSVPVFRLKQDAIPGRTVSGWFKPTRAGVYDIQCAEICGIGHGIMAAKIYVHTPEEYNKWLAAASDKQKGIPQAPNAPKKAWASNTSNVKEVGKFVF